MFAGAFSVHWLVALFLLDPELTRERLKRQRTADPVVLFLIRALSLGTIVTATLDVGRFHWLGAVPLAISVVALALMIAALAFALTAVRANRFFVPAVRIQTERGHHVVDRGPYRYIRHPGYAATLVFLPTSALAIGSWLAVLPGVLAATAFVYRAVREDAFLREKLEGYADYARRVRYRLVPGLW